MELILIRGPSGSGKSTLAKLLAEDGDVICEADQFYMINEEYKFNIKLIGDAHKWCQSKVAYNLLRGKTVFVSNTSIYERDIHCYNDIADRYDARFSVISCINDFGSVHNVPEEVLENQREKYKVITTSEWFKIRSRKMEDK